MKSISISIEVENDKANINISANKPNITDLSVALSQLEIVKLRLIAKIAKHSKLKDNENEN
jgi:hypothetical protein